MKQQVKYLNYNYNLINSIKVQMKINHVLLHYHKNVNNIKKNYKNQKVNVQKFKQNMKQFMNNLKMKKLQENNYKRI